MAVPSEKGPLLHQLIYHDAPTSTGESEPMKKLTLSLPFSNGRPQYSEMVLDFALELRANILVPARFAFYLFLWLWFELAQEL
jgi:hypothetical protein